MLQLLNIRDAWRSTLWQVWRPGGRRRRRGAGRSAEKEPCWSSSRRLRRSRAPSCPPPLPSPSPAGHLVDRFRCVDRGGGAYDTTRCGRGQPSDRSAYLLAQRTVPTGRLIYLSYIEVRNGL